MKRARKRDDPRRFFQGKNPRDAGRRNFADAVADDRGWFHAPRFPERGERHLHCKNRGLTNLRPLHLASLLRCGRVLREARNRVHGRKRRVASLHRLAKDRLVLHQFAAHAPPLRALTAHDEADARRCSAARGEGRADFRAVFVVRKPIEFLDDLRPIASDQRHPMRVMIPTDAQGVGEIRQNGRAAIRVGMFLHPPSQVRGRSPKRFLRARGKDQRPRPIAGLVQLLRARRGGGAARMTCAFAPPNPNEFTPAIRSPVACGKRLQRGRHAQLELLEINMRTRRLKMEARRNLAVLQHEHRLEQSGDARRGFQVSEICFDRANRQRRAAGRLRAERFGERMRLDRIADRRTGAVRFDKTDLLRRNSRIRTRPAPRRLCASGLGSEMPLVCPS